MIWNIIDMRKRRYRWAKITAIIEPTLHDNSCEDSDQAPATAADIVYDERPEISLADAVIWAQSTQFPVTLYLYDLGQGINAASAEEIERLTKAGKRFSSE